jgi:hypothetical protein
MSRGLTVLLVVATLVLVASEKAAAFPGDGSGQGTGGRTDSVITAFASYETAAAGSSGGRWSAASCSWTMVDGEAGLSGTPTATWPYTDGGVTYHLWRRDCPDGSTLVQVAETTPQDLLPQLFQQLREQALPAPVPVFELLDKQYGWAYVRTPLDFRAGDAWRTVSVTASLGPVWATATAVPQRLTFDPGDPHGPGPVSCGGDAPLAPYVAAVPGACSYTYANGSSTSPLDGYHFQTRFTIEWAISWTSSTGAGGVLAPYSTSANALLAVAEVKALITCTGPRPEQGSC